MHDTSETAINGVEVSVIIPTLAQAARARLLQRAIDSILRQPDVVAEVIVVVNGSQYDETLVDNFEQSSGIRVIRFNEANVSRARHEGIKHATGQFFCFLDDDDELLPETLSDRVKLAFQHSHVDIIVTNGYGHCDSKDAPLVEPGMAQSIAQDAGESFFLGNWFASPAPLFRAESIDASLFDFSFKYFEWTYLFFLLLSKEKKFHFDGMYAYRVYGDSPLSASKSIEYSSAYPSFLLTLKKLPLPRDMKDLIQRRYITALNTQSDLERSHGSLGKAWKSHIKCLLAGGWRYLPYTRHLLIP